MKKGVAVRVNDKWSKYGLAVKGERKEGEGEGEAGEGVGGIGKGRWVSILKRREGGKKV